MSDRFTEDRATLMATAVTEPGGFPVRDAPLPPIAEPLPVDRVDAALKRTFDVVASLMMLLALLPLILIVALLVRLDSPGPSFFKVRRIGRNGRDLMMLKFRKMHDDAAGIALTTHDDDRLTRIGAFLARSKLDELPQLWHVLRGDMSLVGPRPETLDFVSHHREEYDEILSVRPGLVGFSQIAFLTEGRILSTHDPLHHYVSAILPQKVALDLMYARERTVWLDIKILAWSLVAVLLRREVAVSRRTGRMNLRKR
ncbi:MAG TPA: sugar transferase [Solirubrobacteraceae bacterium]|nr:sugar transferase [Solirubrobacteraceae bacterium]